MESDRIDDKEILYRAVKKSDPNGFIDGKPTAALFIDPKGTSVDRDGGRDEVRIIEAFIERFGNSGNYENAVKIEAVTCRRIGTVPKAIHNKNHIYHAEIHESEEQVEISFLKALKLASECIVVS